MPIKTEVLRQNIAYKDTIFRQNVTLGGKNVSAGNLRSFCQSRGLMEGIVLSFRSVLRGYHT